MVVAIRLRSWLIGGLVLAVVACAQPAVLDKVPVFLFLQVSPDRQSLEAIVPSSLWQYAGGIEGLQQQLPPTGWSLLQFGKLLAVVQTQEQRISENFGGIAVFKLAQPLSDDRILAQQGIILVPSGQANPLPASLPSFQYNCPSQVQAVVLSQGKAVFKNLGVQAERLGIASLVCVDIDGDQVPEIVTGLRLDNPLRPLATDPQGWQNFLALPPAQRQEYSVLLLLRKTGDRWTSEPLITHQRTLSYFNDSISSYVLANAHDLTGDRRLELVVQEIGLTTMGLWVLTPNPDLTTATTTPWLDYYLRERSLNIQE